MILIQQIVKAARMKDYNTKKYLKCRYKKFYKNIGPNRFGPVRTVSARSQFGLMEILGPKQV